MFGTRVRAARRQEFVATYKLPHGVGPQLQRELGESVDLRIAFQGLYQWLRIHAASPGSLAMPSRAVDLLWHDFILHTVEYQEFCRHAYGRTLHHSPQGLMDEKDRAGLDNEEMGRAYAMACADEGIRLPLMVGLPVLFRVDRELAIPNGQHWILDCAYSDCAARSPARCVRHQVRPFIPKNLPMQRDPKTGQWLVPKSQKFSMGGGNMSAGAYSSGGGHTCGGHA